MNKTQLAIKNGRTVYTNNVFSTANYNTNLLKLSSNKKLGKFVSKGRHKNKYLYSLSLEERKTCPKTCFHWKTCYGNNMPFAHRFRVSKNLLVRLHKEIKLLSIKHKEGILIRLHVLGDFYSVAYVKFWKKMLSLYPNISIYGYTARTPYSKIGKEIIKLRGEIWDRFSVRLSNNVTHKLTANSEDLLSEKLLLSNNVIGLKCQSSHYVICPEQLNQVKDCASCGLCWNNNIDNIIFKTH